MRVDTTGRTPSSPAASGWTERSFAPTGSTWLRLAETVPADSLSAVSGRIVEILHEYHATDGSGGSDDLLRAGAYVLRRPAELADSVSEEPTTRR